MDDDGRAYDASGRYHSPDEALAALAGRQHGVVSWRQLLALGLTKDAVRRRVERRRLLRLHTGVYAVGHLALTLDSRRLAAVMACGREALLSHRAAGELHALLRSAARLEVTVPHGARRSRDGIAVHRSRGLAEADRAAVRGIPVTSVARTIVDLAEVLSQERLAAAVEAAEKAREFDLRAVEDVLDRLPGRCGRRRLARALSDYRPDPRFTRSAAERRLLELCARHGLPPPRANLWIGGCEVDAYWPDVRVAVEIDGRAAHATQRAFREDRARDRRLAAQGIRVARVTWSDLDDAERLAGELRAIRGATPDARG